MGKPFWLRAKGKISWAEACKNDYSYIITEEITSGADVDQLSRISIATGIEESLTGLMIAAAEGHKNMVELLIECAASLDIQSPENGDTALMFACKQGHVDIVKLLLINGAKVRLVNNTGHSADSFAEEEIKDLLKAAILAHHFINNRLTKEISSVWEELFIAKIAQHIVTNSDVGLCSRFYEYCANNNLKIDIETNEMLELYQPLPPEQLDYLGHIRDYDSDESF